MSRLAGSRGFTLIELVVAMSLGIIVLLAAFTVVDRSFFGTKAIADREDALQRGRNALEQFTRQLRSRVCVGNTNSVTYGDDSTVSFYTYMGDPTAGSLNPEWHTISFSGSTITERDYKITSTSPSIVVASSAYRTMKLTNVAQAGSTPVFQYYRYDPSQQGTGALLKLTTPLSASDQGLVADIKLSYVVRPTGITTTQPQSTTFVDDALWRAPDPDSPATVPCAPSS